MDNATINNINNIFLMTTSYKDLPGSPLRILPAKAGRVGVGVSYFIKTAFIVFMKELPAS